MTPADETLRAGESPRNNLRQVFTNTAPISSAAVSPRLRGAATARPEALGASDAHFFFTVDA